MINLYVRSRLHVLPQNVTDTITNIWKFTISGELSNPNSTKKQIDEEIDWNLTEE
jgi:hypothetical protein